MAVHTARAITRRSALAAVIAAAYVAGLVGFASQAAIPTMTVESQAWWSKTGISVPSVVGHHIHVAATIPVTGTIVDGRVDVPVHLTLHDQVGSPNFIRWQDGSTTKGQISVSKADFACTTHDGFTDCQRDMVLPVDFSKFGTGLRELRISLNVPDEQPDGLPGSDSGDQRMYQSFGLEVCVRACSPIEQGGRSLNFIEARGWYQDHEYQNARVTSGIGSIRAGGTVGLKLAPGSSGEPTTFSGVYIDPDMHRHDAGRVLLTRNGSFQGSVTIPTDLAPGVHKFVALASDGQNAGVISIPFTVGGTASPTPTVRPTVQPTQTPIPTPVPSLPASPAPSACGI